MGYILRVRLASFFAGAATASFLGLCLLDKDFKVAHDSISQQMKGLHESLDTRISALEKLKEIETSKSCGCGRVDLKCLVCPRIVLCIIPGNFCLLSFF
ncbi:hypothetical protein NMG60_11017930 [Bertholletia excelsa]